MDAYETKYLQILTKAIDVCALYRPKFGKGRGNGLTLAEFQSLYGADEFYSWFGLSSPLMYAAHKAAGGMTSIYRQIGMGCQRVFFEMLQDHLGLSRADANWSYVISRRGKKPRTLTLDGRIPLAAIAEPAARARLDQWIDRAGDRLGIKKERRSTLEGAVFEVRQGYKSKDSKRQNADVDNAAKAHANGYLPVVVLLSAQIDDDVADRYERASWLLLRGTTHGTALDSAYVFGRDIVGYDWGAFFERNSDLLKIKIEAVLRKLLSDE